MKKTVNIVIFGLLLLIFGSYMFTYQVRQDQVAFLSTLGGKPRTIKEPGPGLRLPWPFQKLEVFDKRVHLETTEYVEKATKDSDVMIQLYYGWKIDDPALFYNSHEGDGPKARVKKARGDLEKEILESLDQELKAEVAGPSYFMPGAGAKNQDNLEELETKIMETAKPQAKQKGLSLEFVGIRRVGLPRESLDQVLNAMVRDWKSKADLRRTNALNQAFTIRNDAMNARIDAVEKARSLAASEVKAAREEARASIQLAKKDPELAEFLIKLDAMERSVKPGATLFLDETMGPFTLLRQLGQPVLPPDNNGTLPPGK